ncbi:MAG: hypothetical protein K5917_03095, partial [Clostridiales bacterium]|nr:hypothetical protein [Clostridiales bacterium]
MKKAKKVISLLLAVIMLFGVTTSAFAEEKTLKEKINTFLNGYFEEIEEEYLEEKSSEYFSEYFSITYWYEEFQIAKMTNFKSDVFTAEELENMVVAELDSDEYSDILYFGDDLKNTIIALETLGIDSSNVGGKYNLREIFEDIDNYLVNEYNSVDKTLKAVRKLPITVEFNFAVSNLQVFTALKDADKDTVNKVIDAVLSCQAKDGHFDLFSQKDLENPEIAEYYDYLFEGLDDYIKEYAFLFFTDYVFFALSPYASTNEKVQQALEKAEKYIEKYLDAETGLIIFGQEDEKTVSLKASIALLMGYFVQNIDRTDLLETIFDKFYDEEKNGFYEYEYDDDEETGKSLVKVDVSYQVVNALAYYLAADLTSKEVVATNEDTTITVTANGFKSGTKLSVTNVENTADSYKALIKVAGVDEDKVIACVDITP